MAEITFEEMQARINSAQQRLQDEDLLKPNSLLDRVSLIVSDAMDKGTELPLLGGSFRALRDRAQGATQFIANSPIASDLDRQKYEALRRRSEERYQQSRPGRGDEGIDWDRTVAGGAIDMTVASALPWMRTPAPSLLGRSLKQYGTVGSVAGALTPTEDPDFLKSKAVQTIGGWALGAGTGPLGEYLGKGVALGLEKGMQAVGKAGAWIASKMRSGPLSPDGFEKEVARIYKETFGVDWQKIPEAIRNTLRSEVRKSMLERRNLTPEMVENKATFDALGIDKPLSGWVTRDPMQWKKQFNMAGVEGVGEDITAAIKAANNKLIQNLDDLASGAGNKVDAGRRLVEFTRGWIQQAQAVEKGLWSAVRNAAGREIDIPLQPVAQTIGNMQKQGGYGNLPAEITSRLKELGVTGLKQKQTFTLENADDLVQMINRNWDKKNGPLVQSLSMLRKAVEESVDNGVDAMPSGSQAREMAVKAREFGRWYRTLRDSADLFKDVSDMVAQREAGYVGDLADDAIANQFINAPRDMAERAFKALPPELREDVKKQIALLIRQKATWKEVDPTATAARFKQGLDALGGEDRLSIFFNKSELSMLRNTAKALELINNQPAGVTPNRSGTSQAILDLVGNRSLWGDAASRMSGVPLPLVNSAGKSVIQTMDANAARAAVGPSLSEMALPKDVLSPEMLYLLTRGGGLLGSGAAGSVGGLQLGQ